MAPLHRKLLRDLRRLWAQVLAIALVMAAGVMTLILGAGAYQSLSTTRADYYETNRFADVFATVTRAPKSVTSNIAAINGVAVAEPRIAKLALADIDGMREPASVMMLSLPGYHQPQLNRLFLRTGRLPEPAARDEVVVSEGFAKAHGLMPGSSLHVILNGVKRALQVSGVALSPEFIYALGPGDMMPDERRFGVVWMGEERLAAAYGLQGAFSSLLLKLVPGASLPQVIQRIDALLARYGGQGAYGRKDHASHAFLDGELQQLRAMSRVLPPIFLLVAAFLVNMTLSRLIALEREQIGLLKALGYSSWAVMQHYIEFVTLIALLGVAIGSAVGVVLGNGLAMLYARFFNFPYLVFNRQPDLFIIAGAITIAAAVLGAFKAVRDVAFLPPAVAMSPPAPVLFRKAFGGEFAFGRFVQQSAVMVSRHLMHRPGRSLNSILGAAFAVAVLVGSLWSFGSVEYMIDVSFYRAERQDASINFATPRPLAALHDIAHLPGILRAEPFRAVAVKLKHGHLERRLAVIGKPPGTDLSRLLDASLTPVTLPTSGIAVSSAVAEILGLRTGDTLTVELLEGDHRSLGIPVAAIVEGYLGLSAYMDLTALNHALREDDLISGVNVSIDSAKEGDLFAALKRTPAASFITLQKVSQQRFRDTLAQNMTTMITVYVSLAAIIAFGVVYNFARISLSEQGRELASLRVLGFTRGEVSRLLLSEIAVIILLAQPLGWLIGYGFALAMVKGFTSELYRVPLVVGREVYAYASVVVIAAAIVSGLVVRRRIDTLDMIAVLKTRE